MELGIYIQVTYMYYVATYMLTIYIYTYMYVWTWSQGSVTRYRYFVQ